MYILQDAEMMNDYPSIKRDYNQLEYAASILSMVDSCVSENDDHESIFKDLVEVLEHFQKELVIAFGFRLGKRLGYPLSLKPDGRIVKGFNIERGGLIYQGESLSVDLDLNLTTILLKLIHLSYDTIEKIDEINFIKLKMCLVKYYEYHLDIRLKHI
jgi:DNA repair protein RecO (recombination protein O)